MPKKPIGVTLVSDTAVCTGILARQFVDPSPKPGVDCEKTYQIHQENVGVDINVQDGKAPFDPKTNNVILLLDTTDKKCLDHAKADLKKITASLEEMKKGAPPKNIIVTVVGMRPDLDIAPIVNAWDIELLQRNYGVGLHFTDYVDLATSPKGAAAENAIDPFKQAAEARLSADTIQRQVDYKNRYKKDIEGVEDGWEMVDEPEDKPRSP